MGVLIVPGQPLLAGQEAGQLNQYYGYADADQTTVTAASFANLSSVYTIPAGEAYAGAAYELECAGYGTQASSSNEALTFAMTMNGAVFGGSPTIAGAAFAASQPFRFHLKFQLVCADGVSGWWCSLAGSVAESGTSYNNSANGSQTWAVADANTGVRTQSVSSAISVAVQAKWAGTTGSPTITNTKTVFRKIA